MKITIDIDDTAANDVLQNIALAKGWTDVTDEQARVKLGQDIGKEITQLARTGQNIKKRNEEQATLDASLAKVTVS